MDCLHTDLAYKYIDKCKFKIQHFIPHKVIPDESMQNEEVLYNKETDSEEIKYPQQIEAFKQIKYASVPSVCLWNFMTEDEICEIMKITEENVLYTKIEKNINNYKYPHGSSKKLVIVLILTVLKFCKINHFDVKQTGATISIFYLTHLHFIRSLWMVPEEIYYLFKKYVFLHSILMPPYSIKIFTVEESSTVIMYFSKIYLRNLPLIRFLVMPNYALKLKCEKTPPPPISPPKATKTGKQDKKK